MKKEFNYNRYLKNNRLLKENADMEEGNYGSYGGAYASRYDGDIDSSPRPKSNMTAKKLNKLNLVKTLLAATKTKSEYGYPILNKGWASGFMKYIQIVEDIVKAGEDKFNPEKVMRLSDRVENLPGGWESARSAGKEWTKMEIATSALAGALYEGEWIELIKYWNNLCTSVDAFKAPAPKGMKEGWREDAGIYPTKSWKDIDADMDAEREELRNSDVVKNAAAKIGSLVSNEEGFSAEDLTSVLSTANLTPLEFEQAAQIGGLELDTIQYMDDEFADYEVLNQNYIDQGAAIAFEGGKFHSIG